MQLKCTPQTGVDAVHSSTSARKEWAPITVRRTRRRKRKDGGREEN